MAVVNPDDPEVPTTCADFALDPNLNPTDCPAMVVNVGPGRNLYGFDEPFPTDPTLTEINTRITAGTGVGPLFGTFSKAANANNVIRADGVSVVIPTEQTWTINMSNTSTYYRELARQTQNGGVTKHWYVVDVNGNWHGGRNGICPRADGGPAKLILSGVIPTDENAPQTIEGTITAIGKYDAKVIPSPVALILPQ